MAGKYYIRFPLTKFNPKIEMNNSNSECYVISVSFLYSGKTETYFYHCFNFCVHNRKIDCNGNFVNTFFDTNLY